jgi:hypothetical protein
VQKPPANSLQAAILAANQRTLASLKAKKQEPVHLFRHRLIPVLNPKYAFQTPSKRPPPPRAALQKPRARQMAASTGTHTSARLLYTRAAVLTAAASKTTSVAPHSVSSTLIIQLTALGHPSAVLQAATALHTAAGTRYGGHVVGRYAGATERGHVRRGSAARRLKRVGRRIMQFVVRMARFVLMIWLESVVSRGRLKVRKAYVVREIRLMLMEVVARSGRFRPGMSVLFRSRKNRRPIAFKET